MVKANSSHGIYIPAHRERGERNWRAISLFPKDPTYHIPLARIYSCSHISLQGRLRDVTASWAARAQLTLGDEGVLWQKEERLDLERATLCHGFSNRSSCSPPVLGPTTTSPSRRTYGTNYVAFLGFCSANQIVFLTFPTQGQSSGFLNLLCHLQLMHLLSSFQSFKAHVFSLSPFPWRFIPC